MSFRRLAAVALVCSLFALQPASAAPCVNKFLSHPEGTARQVVTLLTGKLTYEEARELAKSHTDVEWIDESGKTVAVCGDLRPLRPMPVGCDGKTSGVVMSATFLTMRQPSKTMIVKLGSVGAVVFEQQS